MLAKDFIPEYVNPLISLKDIIELTAHFTRNLWYFAKGHVPKNFIHERKKRFPQNFFGFYPLFYSSLK